MASCSQYAAAFGYQLFIVPISACGVDLSAVTGGVKSGGFIDPTSPLSSATKIQEGATAGEILSGDPGTNIVYDNDAVTSETVIRLYGLTNASLETDTGSETVTTYDTESRGFDQNVAVSKSWSLSLEGISQFNDAGYKALRLLEQNAVAGALKVKIGRIGPTGTTEAIYGYATLTGFSESIEAGSIVSWSVTAEGYGPYAIDLDNSGTVNTSGPVASFSFTGGSGLADGTYASLPLTAGSGDATVDVTVSGNTATNVALNAAGTNYSLGNASLDASSIPAAANATAGEVLTMSVVGGTGVNLVDGVYNHSNLVNYSGSGAPSGLTIETTVSGNVVTNVTIIDGSLGYEAAATIDDAEIPGTPNPSEGEILTLDAGSLVGGSGYADGTYNGVALTGGSGGASATADITVAGGAVTNVTLVSGGVDYVAGETLSADDADLGGLGGSLFAIDIATVDENTVSAGYVAVQYTIDTVSGGTVTKVDPTVTITAIVDDNG